MTASRVPEKLIAGDTWAFTTTLADYPAGTWTATLYFEKGDATFNAAASASGTDHAWSIDAATTAAYRAGVYRWRLAVANGSIRYTVDNGITEILTDPAAAGTSDTREHARKVLDAIEAYLEDRNNLQAAGFTVGGRSLSRYTIGDILKLRDVYKAEVAALDAADRSAAGLGTKRRAYVRFDRA